jgi:transcriptional regulator with XRE-family HTH domain
MLGTTDQRWHSTGWATTACSVVASDDSAWANLHASHSQLAPARGRPLFPAWEGAILFRLRSVLGEINSHSMADPAELTPEVARILSLLELLIAAKKASIREVERQLNVSNGTLARLFSGKVSLKFQHILDLLQILDVMPKAFFRVAYSLDDPGSMKAEELLRQVQGLAFPDPPVPTVLTRTEIQRMIDEALAARQVPPASETDSRPRQRRSPPAKKS